MSLIREPFLLGFSTASSEAAYPVTMAQLEKLPVSKKIISFVLPMGYSFNLDGSMMYCTFATIFISQAYNIPLTVPQQVTILLVLLLTARRRSPSRRSSLSPAPSCLSRAPPGSPHTATCATRLSS